MRHIKVKASSVSHLTDARYFAAWEVHWLGFCLDPSDSAYIDPRQVAAIREWVDGPLVCGEFGLADADHIQAMHQSLGLDVVQLNMLCPTEVLQQLASSGIPLLQEVVIEHYADTTELTEWMQERLPWVQAFVLQFQKGGITWADLSAGQPFALSQLQTWCQQFPVILEMDLAPLSPVQVAHQLPGLQGFSLRGGAEEKIGYKNFDELDEWFESWEQ